MSDEAESDDPSRRLDRTLGLVPTFMIGAGAMVGAGIFVFPGLAGGRTGAGAALSFAIGGAIALLVGLAASELAKNRPGGARRGAPRAAVGGAACLALCGFFSTETWWTSAAAAAAIGVYWVLFDRADNRRAGD